MLKEIKYLIFITIITIFIFFTFRFYFYEENFKKSYRAKNNIDKKIKTYSKEIPVLENDTDSIIEYVKQSSKKKKKKYNFWKLLENNEK